jgi:homoserine O-acetyltransferase/O-succinyltransferase
MKGTAIMAFAFGIACSAVAQAENSPASMEFKDHIAEFANYRFRNGQSLANVHIRYSTLGAPRRDAGGNIVNAVMLLHHTGGASGKDFARAEYVNALYAPGKPLDASVYYLIFPDSIGHGGSSKPSDGLRARFPNYRYTDMVDLQYRLATETLGISRLHAIVGISMGGMNAWLWCELYPDAVEGIMPVVSLPTKIAGRNLIMRRSVTQAIRNDPGWNNGGYSAPPTDWAGHFLTFGLLINGVPNLDATITSKEKADEFIRRTVLAAKTYDANDLLYSIESSLDYDPEPGLAAITAKVYAVNFTDDEFNPVALGTLPRLMPKVTNGKYVLIQGSEKTHGHWSMEFPELWATEAGNFMRYLEAKP